jgi:hypothetical protein
MEGAKTIGVALLAGIFIGGGIGYSLAKRFVKPTVVNHVQFVEKKVYVKTNTSTQTTTTKPDGTTTTTVSTTTGEQHIGTSVVQDVRTGVQTSLKLGTQVLRQYAGPYGVSVLAGVRVFDGYWITGQLGYLHYPFVGVGFELSK